MSKIIRYIFCFLSFRKYVAASRREPVLSNKWVDGVGQCIVYALRRTKDIN
ncbi:hypothetical protein MPTK1_4g16920 [Marchantia polymorpha subsp. ruderalis]|uniref:Uncharacterized protein n=2 Tax=Marchantia polymorpha TaxID=3197 RepID=A0AAF6BAP1_MARPO|nr:hypothetical protein MARPO_0148s0028 [Marchantia polymorpha]PTQ29079.1 hypothetical protein MARPO_0148s0028 [Marchantia polymorpha]BBN09075.1 hypothetical protein Mp_4g16920 [Marchantia polymorpha subsp. ruderalis]BBN09076.1 hypothetical protein Mp_4g16920 [Marchantia polymorpha subsp. ruderalis]|eukprot:PTQ29078.1 hypothetical protein MARPO_0148s0028 [Marchantia polymorpha]